MRNCDKCGKSMTYQDTNGNDYSFSAFHIEIYVVDNPQASKEAVAHQLGKYYKPIDNVNGMIAWAFCYECILDNLLS